MSQWISGPALLLWIYWQKENFKQHLGCHPYWVIVGSNKLRLTRTHPKREKQKTSLLTSSPLCVRGRALFHFLRLYLKSQFTALHAWPFLRLTTSKVYMGPNGELPPPNPGEVRAAGPRRAGLLNGPGLLLISKLWVINSWSIRCHSGLFRSPGKQNRTYPFTQTPNKIMLQIDNILMHKLSAQMKRFVWPCDLVCQGQVASKVPRDI